jgi:TonB-dependent starch-binding outer membrane protein SusC
MKFESTKMHLNYALTRKAFLFFFLFLASMVIHAQKISGKILDEKGLGIPGADIREQGTDNGTITDLDGNFSLELTKKGSALEINYLGYKPYVRFPEADKSFDVTMEPEATLLEETVITGYSTQKRKNILGASVSVNADQITQTTPNNALEGIQGRVSGVQVLGGGGPGEDFDIRIRGISTLNSGTGPLYVVDGQQFDNISNLDPNDIATMEVLKDGASAAIYGSKSANGVILITTKGGKVGKTKLEINSTQTFSQLSTSVSLANTKERIFYEKQRSANPLNLTTIENDSLGMFGRISNDLIDLLTRTGSRNLVNMTISGGNNNAKFYWNTGLLNQSGVILNSGFRRINTNLKLDATYNENIKAGTRIIGSFDLRNGLDENTVFQQMVERIPYFPIFEPDGSYTPEIAGRQNPVAEALFTRRDNKNYKAQMFNYVDVKLYKGISFRTNLGANFGLGRANNFDPIIVQTFPNPATASERTGLDFDWQLENLLEIIT